MHNLPTKPAGQEFRQILQKLSAYEYFMRQPRPRQEVVAWLTSAGSAIVRVANNDAHLILDFAWQKKAG
jgi:hypothetical protein